MRTLLVVDVLPLLVTGGLGLASHLVDHLLSVFFLQRIHYAIQGLAQSLRRVRKPN